jgi:thiol-disulfide isomerase/thioredoxin
MKRCASAAVVIFLLAFSKGETPAFVKMDALNFRVNNGSDTTYVINFWATWCAPCIQELHYFTELDSIRKNEKVKVILVSMDFKKDIGTKLVPFIAKRKIKTEVLVMDELYDNEWMPKVDSAWQGNIPATLILNTSAKYRRFLPRETTLAELDSLTRMR